MSTRARSSGPRTEPCAPDRLAALAADQLTLTWEKSGRSFRAVAGGLVLRVKPAPPRHLGEERRWMVAEVFGFGWWGDTPLSFPSLQHAEVHAERLARKALQQASDALAGAPRAR